MLRDHIEGFELSESAVRRYANELQSLSMLRAGLEYLYLQVARAEDLVKARIDPMQVVFSLGNDPLMNGIRMDLIACTFHWYAVSACNLVRLVGWIRHDQHSASPTPQSYVKTVLPEVLPWRNKIAAHFAKSDQRDSLAERDVSVMAPIGFHDDAFYASPFSIRVKRGNNVSTSESLRPWSLTKVHQGLQSRYWPSQIVDAASQ